MKSFFTILLFFILVGFANAAEETIRVYGVPGGDGGINTGPYPADWNTQRGDQNGRIFVEPTQARAFVETGGYSSSNGYLFIKRGYFTFDTSIIPDDAVIASSSLNLYVDGVWNDFSVDYSWIGLYKSTQASSTNLALDDISKCGLLDNPTPVATNQSINNIVDQAYTSFPLFDNKLKIINKLGYTNLCLREGHDVMNIETKNNNLSWKFSGVAFTTTESNDLSKYPYLEITYKIEPKVDPLVLRYMPVLAMGEGESYRPMDVDSYVEKSALWDTNGLRDDVQVKSAGDLTMSEFENIVGQGSTADMYLAFSTPDTAGTLDVSAAQVAYQSSGATSTVYYRKMIDGDYTVLQYWYFYAMNDWKDKGGFNNHEGDWESVFVYLKTNNLAAGPEYVAYSAHHNDGDSGWNLKQYDSVRRTWNGGEVLKEGDSPISFVAVGSHANYPGNNDGEHRVGLKYDRTSDIEANKIHPADFAQKTAISETTPFWMNYEGLWGAKRGALYVGGSAPQGPVFSNVSGTIRFSNPVKWAGIDKIIKRIIKEKKKKIVFDRIRVALEFQKEVLAGTLFEVSPYDEVVSFGKRPDNVVMLPKFYDIESSLENGTFDVEVSLPYDAQVLAALGGKAKNLKAFLYEPAANTWTMQDSDVDAENQTVSFETTHFSRYAIGFVKETSLEDLFDTLVGQIKDSSLQQYHKRYLVRYARLVERFANRDSRYGKRIATRLLKNMDRMFNRYEQRGYLTESQQEEISATIEDIEDVLKNVKEKDEHEWEFKKQKHWKKYEKREE